MENQGLRGENGLLKTWLDREIKRGDKLAQIDTNSQRMDTNAVIIQTSLEKTVSEKNDRIAELTDDLRSCQNNQKWIAGVSFIGGGLAGYFVRGKVGSIGDFNRPIPRTFEMPNTLRPVTEKDLKRLFTQ